MDYEYLCGLRDRLNKKKTELGSLWLNNLEENFDILYTHNSTAIEGNTLSLIETKLILDDKISVGGKSLREIFEVTNHSKAFKYVRNSVLNGIPLNEKAVKDIHAILMENIMTGGVYRNVSVKITGAAHKPPPPSEMFGQIKEFFAGLNERAEKLDVISLAAYTHAEFVKIHPFEDGNGRTARLIMNWQLMSGGFLPVSIAKENRLPYFETLEDYAVRSDLAPFALMVEKLEEEQLLDALA
jgi:Fic family protein